jgi:hypothetical protein
VNIKRVTLLVYLLTGVDFKERQFQIKDGEQRWQV